MSSQGNGYWLNSSNDKWVDVTAHELSVKDKADQKKLGLTKDQAVLMDLAKGDADAIRLKAIKIGLIRVRDYTDGVHVQFWADRGEVRGCLISLYIFMRKTKLDKAWQLHIENLRPSAKDYVSLSMEGFKDAINNDTTIMKESRNYYSRR